MNRWNLRLVAFCVCTLVVIGAAQAQDMDHQEMDHDAMDHDAMDHDAMDHDAMEHDGMDHEEMDHDAMDHSGHHDMKQEEYDLLRERILTYRTWTNKQIMDNMMAMPPTYERYVSDKELKGDLGIIVLTHGAFEPGDTYFANSLMGLAQQHPVSVGYGMAMMNGNHIQSAIDNLEAAGAKKIVCVPAALSANGTVYEQWAFYFGEREDAVYLDAPRMTSNVPMTLAEPMRDHPMASQMLLDHAQEISNNPKNEFVLIVGHGPSEPDDNVAELKVISKHAERVKANGGFADVKAYNFQDDAPPKVRGANVKVMRGWIEEAKAAGLDVIMVGYLLATRGIQHKIPEDFASLDFTFNEKGLSSHPDFAKWVEANALEHAAQL
jgi:pentapeptide MXKDX repeat protein